MSVDWPVILAFTKQLVTLLAAAAWPAAAVFAALRFRDPIGRAIDRTKSFKALGAEVEMPSLPQPEATPTNAVATVPYAPTDDPVLSAWDARLRVMLDAEPLPLEQRYLWAIRTANVFGILARHEQHYRWIYGSQIAFLKHLNQFGEQSLNETELFYELHSVSPPPVDSYTFDNWLHFLITQDDVVRINTEYGEKIALTDMGRAFLGWMVAQRVAEQKPL